MQIKFNVHFQVTLGAIKNDVARVVGRGGVPKISDKKLHRGEWGVCK